MSWLGLGLEIIMSFQRQLSINRQTVLLHLLTSLTIYGRLARFILGFQALGSNTPSHGLVASSVRR
jgi:hypothetical protein